MSDAATGSQSLTLLTIERIKAALHKTYDSHIDVSDVRDPNAQQREPNFLTRALSAFCIAALSEALPADAARSVTDGYDDGGIDAIYTDAANKTIYVVQSKWSGTGNRTIDKGDGLKFLDGLDHLISADFSHFNQKIRDRESEIRANLLERADMRIVLILAYTSSHPLAAEVIQPIKKWLDSQNNAGDRDVFSYEVFDIARIYKALQGRSRIQILLALKQWGTVEDPYRAYYGVMTVQDVAQWAVHGNALMDKNIRFYRGSTDVNESLDGTLKDHATNFWYFNNGVTLLCDKVEKTHLHGNGRDLGVFRCDGVSVVNGGQTVGVIWERARRDAAGFQLSSATVSVRVISLEGCPEEFANTVARATNTQNQIRPLDFAALDPRQQRLAHEMELRNLRYAYKSGDELPRGEKGCGVEEAAVALACAESDSTLAVLAKRAVGQLWSDTSREPYTKLFHDGLGAETLWRAVRILRVVSRTIEKVDKAEHKRGELVAIHGNRFILHRVFQEPVVREFRSPKRTDAELFDAAEKATPLVFAKMARSIEDAFPSAYLANLFKNTPKCVELAGRMNANTPPLLWTLPQCANDPGRSSETRR